MRKLRLSTRILLMLTFTPGLLVLIFAAAINVQAQTYTPLYELGTNKGDPNTPQGVFAQGRDGNLYSTSSSGGANGFGAVFQLTPDGTEKTLYSFQRADGIPFGGLTLGTDGYLYGVTSGGGSVGAGSVFKISTDGKFFAVVHSFNGTTEGTPYTGNAVPIQGTDGNFYGTAADGNSNYGTVYKMTPTGQMTVLCQFPCSATRIGYPKVLLQATDGNFYGIAGGNTNNSSMVYKITPQRKFTVLHIFAGYNTDGAGPTDLIQGSDGNLYGTTGFGGSQGSGTIFKMNLTGTPYKILQNSQANFPGLYPQSLTQATDGKFYGVAYSDDNYIDHCSATSGLLFQIISSGAYADLFCNFKGANGIHPLDTLLQHTNGTFYSATYEGGTGPNCLYCGVLYSLGMGFGPFVTFLPSQSVGKVNTKIGIFGQGFNGATKVSFNGAAASFTIASDTYLTATVPNGAKTGPISVTALGSTLKSNKTFRVTPQIKSFTPTSGSVGSKVTITGVSLAQTTAVTIGGKNATFVVVNDSTVTATVPGGAATGKKITIKTLGGTATSATSFTVT